MKITIGLTTWTEHPALINDEERPVTLNEYAQHLPTVEADSHHSEMAGPGSGVVPVYCEGSSGDDPSRTWPGEGGTRAGLPPL